MRGPRSPSCAIFQNFYSVFTDLYLPTLMIFIVGSQSGCCDLHRSFHNNWADLDNYIEFDLV